MHHHRRTSSSEACKPSVADTVVPSIKTDASIRTCKTKYILPTCANLTQPVDPSITVPLDKRKVARTLSHTYHKGHKKCRTLPKKVVNSSEDDSDFVLESEEELKKKKMTIQKTV